MMTSPSSSFLCDDHDNWPIALMKEELYDENSTDMNLASCGDDVEMSSVLADEEVCRIDTIDARHDNETDFIPSFDKKANGGNSLKTRGIPVRSQEEIDSADAQVIIKMYGSGEVQDTMKCCKNGCNTVIPKEIAVKYRQSLQEMIKDEKDIVVLSLLASHRRLAALTHAYGSFTRRGECRLKNSKTFKRIDNKYYFADLPICRGMFLFLHDMGKSQFENLVKHYDQNGFVPRVHKSQNRRSTRKNVLNPEDIDKVILFIKQYADQHGKHMTDRHQKNKNTGIIKLPNDVTKRSVWEEYCKVDGVRKMARRTFTQLWNKYCPFVSIMNKSASTFSNRSSNQHSTELTAVVTKLCGDTSLSNRSNSEQLLP